MRLKISRLGSAVLVGAMVTVAAQAHAQATPPVGAATAPSRQELNPDERRSVRPQVRNTDLFSAPSALPCPLESSTLTFKLQGVDIVGSSVNPEDAKAAYEDLVGTTIPVSKICQIRDRLSSILFKRGRLARVEVPEQTISGGRLRLEVTEARIVAVRVRGDVGPGQDRVEAYLEKLRGMTPFDLDTAQRYLLLANELPGMRIAAALRPSAEGRGAIDLEVQVSRDAVDYLAAVQNTGSESLGPWSVLARTDLNSFTKFGERTTLIGYHTLTDNEQWIAQVVEEAEFGADGLTGRASLAYGQSRPGAVLKPLKLEGESFVASASVRYPIIKLRRYSLSVSGGLDMVNQTTTFPGGDVLADEKLRILWTKANGEFVRNLGEGLAISGTADIEVRKGLSGLGASKAGDPTLSRIQGHPDAWLVRYDSDTHLTYRWLDVGLRTEGQYANTPLLSYEEQAVGGLTIGRGYEPAVLSGDKALAAELKLQIKPIPIAKRFSVSPYIYYDQAYVDNLDTGSESRTLRSYGGGVETRLPFGIRASLAYADPLDKPFRTATDKPASRVIFQLVIAR